MKYLVIWFVVNSWIIPCPPQTLPEWTDLYGQKFSNHFTTSIACVDTEVKRIEKEFESYESASEFMVTAQTECQS